MNKEEYSDDSDSSDEEYDPFKAAASGDVPSEVDSDGDSEEPLSDVEDNETRKPRRKTKKKSKNDTPTSNDNELNDNDKEKSIANQEVDKKKHADDLWASFKMDTGFQKKTTTTSTNGTTKPKAPEAKPAEKPKDTAKVPDTVKITQIFEFAGEQVKVEKEVKADSAEARLSVPNSKASQSQEAGGSALSVNSAGPKRKSGGLGGIGAVLNQINKKQKLSVLEKTKLDWNQYKQKEQIEDELESYKKGKDGYLEKQDFLQRADHRRFEIEKEVRAVERSKRVNNS